MFSNASQMTSSGYGENHSIGGTFGSAAAAMEFNREMMQNQMSFNAEEAQKNRDWQERMSNTAYQRAVQDMVKAGINPILAATNGGATTGSGGQAAAGLASGMPEQYNESSGYNMNSANSMSNWGLQIEALGNTIASIFGGLFDMSNLGGANIENVVNSVAKSAKDVMKDLSNPQRMGNTNYDRWLHGREWK